tara:strand:+ start:181 stop:1101 length:921 start_codon:yes stop_codon:yes gene_type:complete
MGLLKQKKALVTKKFNNFFYVDILENYNNEERRLRFLCKSRKNLYFKNQLIVVGDEVIISEINLEARTAIIENLIERKNYLARPAIANITDIFVVISVEEPVLDLSQVNMFLVNSEYLKVNVSLIITKCDLASKEKRDFLYSKFASWGYKPWLLSIEDETGFKIFVDQLKMNKCSILIGPSGVGKTTILNQIIPNINRATSDVSKKIKRGKNTTRNVELFYISTGSYIVDTPGFNMQTINLDLQNIAYLFPELANQLKAGRNKCKFRDCLHITEPGCQINRDFERYKFYKEMIINFKTLHCRNLGD